MWVLERVRNPDTQGRIILSVASLGKKCGEREGRAKQSFLADSALENCEMLIIMECTICFDDACPYEKL